MSSSPASADLDRSCASLFTVGFHGFAPSAEILELIDRGISGVILFARNVESAEQVAELTAALKHRAGRPLLISIDQEGGRVARLRARHGFTEVPPMRALGMTDDVELARQVGQLLGRELRSVGIDLDYAPVIDVDSNPANPVIGDRSFGSSPDLVSRLGVALAQGLESAGVASCAKHFPGHGDTLQDSHKELPHLPHGLERLERVELAPFRAYSAAGLASVMTAHVVFDAIDPSRPATLSRPVIDLLRQNIGYRGCILSDDLEMGAIADRFQLEQVVPEAMSAGVDGLLVCHRADVQHRSIDLLRQAVENRQLSEGRLMEANDKVARLLNFASHPVPQNSWKTALNARESAVLMACFPRLTPGVDPTAVGPLT